MTAQVHITYKTAKRIKEFLGESAPEPIGTGILDPKVPRYQLHDLLSKPFCEAIGAKLISIRYQWPWHDYKFKLVYEDLCEANYRGGLPAVEKALMEMMEAK